MSTAEAIVLSAYVFCALIWVTAVTLIFYLDADSFLILMWGACVLMWYLSYIGKKEFGR